jgi:predicted transcriptional regulator
MERRKFNGQKERSIMSTAKETMAEIIAQQPDDSSYDELLRELAFANMVKRGLDDADAGRTVSDEEIKERIDSWRK